MATKNSPALHLSFDVGHSSIGWAVLSPAEPHPLILGTGTVLFPADDCLASQRRAFRRQRRHIRATRQRIARMKTLLAHLGVLSPEQLDSVTSSSPWKLAARVLAGGPLLTWPELWDVLRWYAHNRGYDGNRRWAGGEAASEADQEDTQKVENARGLMKEHGRKTMAETYCAVLKVDPLGDAASSDIRFKGLNAAFPRDIIEAELRRLLRAHAGKLPAVDASLERALLGTENDLRDDDAWKAISCPALSLPRRFKGSLLLGQSVPRFDNRLIGTCPFTWQSTLAAELAKGTDPATAKHRAGRMAKVPAADCPEFYRYRWAMTLANVRSDGTPLSLEHRRALDAQMQAAGYLTAREFKEAVRELTGHKRDNLDNLLVHPDVERSLVLDPARQAMKREDVQTFWSLLPEKQRLVALNKLRRGKKLTIADLLADHAEARAALEKWHAAGGKKGRGKKDAPPLTLEQVLASPIKVNPATGRAPYSRAVMTAVHIHVFAHTEHPSEEGGPLFRSEAILEAQLERRLDERTNNHLVRHRLLILERLYRDLVKNYAQSDAGRIKCIIVEVTREISEFSGKDSQEKKEMLNRLLADHRKALAAYNRALGPDRNLDLKTLGGGMVRKIRVWHDQGMVCPYTGCEIDPKLIEEKGALALDHIIPYSQRQTDALEALVLTFHSVNALKDDRTGLQFIKKLGGTTVPGTNLTLRYEPQYKQAISKLKPATDPRKWTPQFKSEYKKKASLSDAIRNWMRKEYLLKEHYTGKDFTPGHLTNTSHIAKLAMECLILAGRKMGSEPRVITVRGAVTGLARKSWRLNGCLSSVNDQITSKTIKGDLRELTHLHHALDAAIVGLVNHYVPEFQHGDEVVTLIMKRRAKPAEQARLHQLLGDRVRFSQKGEPELIDLPASLKNQLRDRLGERRVVQHIPSDKTGLMAKQTVWRVLDPKDTHPSAQKQLKLAAKLGLKVPDPDDPNEDQAFITSQTRRDSTASKPKKCLRESKQFWLEYDLVAKSKLFGLQPKPGKPARLKALKAVKVVSENFGVAILGSDGQIIRGYNIVSQLNDLAQKNGGKQPPVLRNGMVITISRGKFAGRYRIKSLKDDASKGILLDLSLPDGTGLAKRDVRLRSIVKEGMQISRSGLTGAPSPQALP